MLILQHFQTINTLPFLNEHNDKHIFLSVKVAGTKNVGY